MDYPLIIHGEEKGVLSVEREGLFTVFEGQCPMQEGLLRLSVYGGGQEAYLGLMQPWSGGLYIKRKLSRSQLALFPENIEYAAPAGLAEAVQPPHSRSSDEAAAAEQAPGFSDGTLTWFRRCDGSLISHDGKSCIVALPEKLREPSPRAVIREIDGISYMLFRY